MLQTNRAIDRKYIYLHMLTFCAPEGLYVLIKNAQDAFP